MPIRYIVYDTEAIPSGDRMPIVNGDDPIRFDSLKDLKDSIDSNTQNVLELEGDRETILDNQSRIENIENADARFNLLGAIKNASSEYYFTNATTIELLFGRETIVAFNVFEEKEKTPTKTVYRCITDSVIWDIVRETVDGVLIKKIVINSQNNPITGYVEIL